MDGNMRAVAGKKAQWKEDFYCAVKFSHQKLFRCYTEVTPMTGMPLISAHILDPFQMLQSLRKLDNRMDVDLEDKTSFTTQYQQVLLRYIESEYCAKH